MKRIVWELPAQYAWPNSLKDTSHVGFIDKQGHKGYISYTGNGRYMAISALPLNAWNGTCNSMLTPDSYCSLKECLKKHKSTLIDVVEFDDRKELFQWLAL